jgi:hypothetical protein
MPGADDLQTLVSADVSGANRVSMIASYQSSACCMRKPDFTIRYLRYRNGSHTELDKSSH